MGGLTRSELHADPLEQFARWMGDAARSANPEPTACFLGTSTPDGVPSGRVVLLKGYDDRGFVFGTSYESRKAQELERNPAACLVFHWHELGRQVRIEGRVARLAPDESDALYAPRPRGSRLSNWVSRQSHVIADRDALERGWADAESRFPGVVPRPETWGGYRLRAEGYEFWSHCDHRLHDRFRYRPDAAGCWLIERLAP